MTNFNDRETYLAWRANWKQEYKDLSEAIKINKTEFKQAQRRNVYSEYSRIHWNLKSKQSTARQMLQDLKEAKEISAKQRLIAMENSHEVN